jgi:hypothetical protein
LLTGWVLVSPLARTIAALLAAQWTAIDRDDETLRIGMQALFADLGITTSSAAA